MAEVAGVEPTTSPLGGGRSIQMSYTSSMQILPETGKYCTKTGPGKASYKSTSDKISEEKLKEAPNGKAPFSTPTTTIQFFQYHQSR